MIVPILTNKNFIHWRKKNKAIVFSFYLFFFCELLLSCLFRPSVYSSQFWIFISNNKIIISKQNSNSHRLIKMKEIIVNNAYVNNNIQDNITNATTNVNKTTRIRQKEIAVKNQWSLTMFHLIIKFKLRLMLQIKSSQNLDERNMN